jgi:signal transduction histidine kinase
MKKRILFVDDEPDVLNGFRRILEDRRDIWEMYYVRSVDAALDQLEDTSIDVIVSDVKMPGKDGFEFLKILQGSEENKNIPVVILTGYKDSDFKRRALELGAIDLLNKPVEREDLLARLHSMLRVKSYQDELKNKSKNLEQMVSMLEDNDKAREELEKKVEERTKELIMLNKHLEKASRAKSEFLANMSHELRTPLNSVIGFGEVLLTERFGKLTEKQARYVANILTGGKDLLSLINDILDLSKIEAGKIELALSEFSFPKLIEGIKTILKELAFRKQITIESYIAPEVAVIKADERKIKQIMYNLLSNAIKFTPDGGKVEVRTDIKDKGLRVSVADTGIGIKQEDIGKLFEPFEQIKNEKTQEYEGSGLGLALTKNLVQLHGGKIWIESEFGNGSTFTFTIPLRRKNG